MIADTRESIRRDTTTLATATDSELEELEHIAVKKSLVMPMLSKIVFSRYYVCV